MLAYADVVPHCVRILMFRCAEYLAADAMRSLSAPFTGHPA